MADDESPSLRPAVPNVKLPAPQPELSLGDLSLLDGLSLSSKKAGENKEDHLQGKEKPGLKVKDEAETNKVKDEPAPKAEPAKPIDTKTDAADDSSAISPVSTSSSDGDDDDGDDKEDDDDRGDESGPLAGPQEEVEDFVPEPQVKLVAGFEELPRCKSFEKLDLKPGLLQGLIAARFNFPSKIQQCALPYLLSPKAPNVIAQSQSGSGKTAAFSVNILQRVDTSINAPQAMVLAPTRELATQLYEVIITLGSQIKDLRVSLLVPQFAKGEPLMLSMADGKDVVVNTDLDSHVLVATAGTLLDKLQKKRSMAREIKVLVVDEADTMVDSQGQGDKCMRIKKQVEAIRGRHPIQMTLFSATFPPVVLDYAQSFAPKAIVMTLPPKEQAVKSISQFSILCKSKNTMPDTLLDLYKVMTVSSSIVFVRSRDEATRIESKLQEFGHDVTRLTGELKGGERDRALARFRQGISKVLIATNVLARGIDVDSVSLVVNYDVPLLYTQRGKVGSHDPNQPDVETYIHRIGRTGRFGRTGVAVTLVTAETSPQLRKIASQIDVKITELPAGDLDYIEDTITRVLNSDEAQADFRPVGFA